MSPYSPSLTADFRCHLPTRVAGRSCVFGLCAIRTLDKKVPLRRRLFCPHLVTFNLDCILTSIKEQLHGDSTNEDVPNEILVRSVYDHASCSHPDDWKCLQEYCSALRELCYSQKETPTASLRFDFYSFPRLPPVFSPSPLPPGIAVIPPPVLLYFPNVGSFSALNSPNSGTISSERHSSALPI